MLPHRQTTAGSSIDLDVPDIAGAALRAAVEPTVGDDAGPDPRPDLDDDHVLVAGGHARAPLPEGQHVDVVVDPDRRAVAGARTVRGSGSRPSRA